MGEHPECRVSLQNYEDMPTNMAGRGLGGMQIIDGWVIPTISQNAGKTTHTTAVGYNSDRGSFSP
jgi:hypothetical protein